LILVLWEASIGGSVEYSGLLDRVILKFWSISLSIPLFKWQEKAKMALKLINWGNKKGRLIEINRPF